MGDYPLFTLGILPVEISLVFFYSTENEKEIFCMRTSFDFQNSKIEELSNVSTVVLSRVLIIIESRFMGDIFADVLSDEPDIEVVGCATSTESALDIIREKDVDVALVSTQLPHQSALELTRMITDIAPAIKVLALGLSDNENHVLKYVEAGATGYILQDSSVYDLIESVHLAQRGEAQISTKVAAAILERLSKMTKVFSRVDTYILEDNKLTQRELEVLDFVGQGFSNQEIASQLVVEVGTVKNHVHNIIKKLNVRNREEAATYLAFMKR
jgi:DNA-binding NarL/FixJ family response regulator